MNKRIFICFAGMLLSPAFAQNFSQMEISGFRVPEYDENGNMTSQFFGERAEIPGDGGDAKITGLRVELYKAGETAGVITSPLCFYNQKTRVATSEETVNADMDRIQLRGRGYVLHSNENTVRVLNESHVTIHDVMAAMDDEAVAGKKRDGTTVITSKELFMDYKARLVRFEQNVKVVDPQMVMDCDTLEVHFSENNEISWIEALGSVRMAQENEGREAVAGRATYDVKTDEFTLEDNPVLSDGRNKLYGERIRVWRKSNHAVSEPARAIIFPDDNNAEIRELLK
ncbi:MAG: LptA/OstA family protein [Kiritimatiellales bacterium]